MDIEQLAQQASKFIPMQVGTAQQLVQPLPGLKLLREHRPTEFTASIYQPVFCLIVQGAKQTTLGERTFSSRAGQCLLVSHDLPVVARVTQAPYLSLLLDLDLSVLRGMYDELDSPVRESTEASALEVQKASPELIDALSRLLLLAKSPGDAKVLGPLISKEIHYRLLTAKFGGVLRRLVRHDSRESAVARAIAHIRRDFRGTIGIPELAREVGMSTSAFHKHFKEVTESSPLQYQKDLRLIEARRMLARGGVSVSSAAFDVGYESPNQFSREYARKFGVPPSRHVSPAA
ncbi:MAG: AraC family transcriptional regulator N-terminal domain-containing protein [Archangium sp.]